MQFSNVNVAPELAAIVKITSLSKNTKYQNTNMKHLHTNCEINTAKCLFLSEIAKFPLRKFSVMW